MQSKIYRLSKTSILLMMLALCLLTTANGQTLTRPPNMEASQVQIVSTTSSSQTHTFDVALQRAFTSNIIRHTFGLNQFGWNTSSVSSFSINSQFQNTKLVFGFVVTPNINSLSSFSVSYLVVQDQTNIFCQNFVSGTYVTTNSQGQDIYQISSLVPASFLNSSNIKTLVFVLRLDFNSTSYSIALAQSTTNFSTINSEYFFRNFTLTSSNTFNYTFFYPPLYYQISYLHIDVAQLQLNNYLVHAFVINSISMAYSIAGLLRLNVHTLIGMSGIRAQPNRNIFWQWNITNTNIGFNFSQIDFITFSFLQIGIYTNSSNSTSQPQATASTSDTPITYFVIIAFLVLLQIVVIVVVAIKCKYKHRQNYVENVQPQQKKGNDSLQNITEMPSITL